MKTPEPDTTRGFATRSVGELLMTLHFFIERRLPATPDDIRSDPANRRGDQGQFFASDFLIVDFWSDEDRWHLIHVLLDDSRAVEGILEVVFVDHAEGLWTS
jgi:hypothetical protein